MFEYKWSSLRLCFHCVSSMKKITFLFLPFVGLLACNENQLNHSLEAKSLGACQSVSPQILLESNIAGDLYTFRCCLPAGFDAKKYDVVRHGDSLQVNLPTASGDTEFECKLKVEAYPRYRFITIAGQTLEIGQVE